MVGTLYPSFPRSVSRLSGLAYMATPKFIRTMWHVQRSSGKPDCFSCKWVWSEISEPSKVSGVTNHNFIPLICLFWFQGLGQKLCLFWVKWAPVRYHIWSRWRKGTLFSLKLSWITPKSPKNECFHPELIKGELPATWRRIEKISNHP